MEIRRRYYYEYVLGYIERAIATVIHVGTRGLMYIAYHTINPVPVAIAPLAFILAGGVVGYRLIYQRKLSNFRLLHKFYICLVALALIVPAAFIAYWVR